MRLFQAQPGFAPLRLLTLLKGGNRPPGFLSLPRWPGRSSQPLARAPTTFSSPSYATPPALPGLETLSPTPDPDSRPRPDYYGSRTPTPTRLRASSSMYSTSPDQSSPDHRQRTTNPDSPDLKPLTTSSRPCSPPNKYRLGEERGWAKKKLTPPDR